MPDPLRCAVVGTGTMGALYGTAFEQVPGAWLAAVVDIDESRAAAVAADHNDCAVFASVDALIDAGAADAAAVALPDFDHRETAVALLDAGVHVLCEKPLAMTREDCQAIAEAAARSSAFLMVNYGNRHRPAARMLRERLLGGELGEIQSIVFKGHEKWTKTMTLRWRDRTDPTWFLISHIVDALTWLTGQRITSVYGLGASGAPAGLDGVTGPSTVTYLAQLERGAHATLTSSWILPSGFARGGDFQVEVIGTEGVARVDFMASGMHFFEASANEPVWDWDAPDFDGHRAGWWFTSCRYFVDCTRSRRQPEPSALDGLRTSAVLAAMSASLESGRQEGVPDWESALT
jgi:predicted dehydrogenase